MIRRLSVVVVSGFVLMASVGSASAAQTTALGQTRILSLSIVPANVEAHVAVTKGLSATGTVQQWNGSSWVGLSGAGVQFYYRPSAATTWRKDNSTITLPDGSFIGDIYIHLGTKYWQARVIPAAGILTSTSTNTVTGTVTDQTHFFTASVTRTKSGSTIGGEIIDYPDSGGPTFSNLNGLTVHLYYRKGGTTTWYASASTKLYTAGFFNFSSPKSYGYYFEVVLPAQFPYLGCISSRL